MRSALSDLIDEYRLRGRATLAHLECRVRLHLLPLLGSLKAPDLDYRHIQAYISRRRDEHAAPATINRELQHVATALRLARDRRAIEHPLRIRLLPEHNVRTGFLTHRQYAALSRALPSYLRPLFVVAYHLGCRRAELLSLTWDQVDSENRQIWLRPAQTKDRNIRLLPVYGDMGAALESARLPGCPLVFHHDGRPIVDFRKAWATACERAGVDGLRFHDLRRTAVRNMDLARVPRATIRKIIGHKTEAMFIRYRIVDQAEIADAGRRTEAYLKRAAGA